MNFVRGDEARRAGAKTLGIRPEHLRITADDARWTGVVRHAEHLGSETFLYVRSEGGAELTIRVAGEAHAAVGDRIGVTPQPGTLHRFDDADRRMPSAD